MNKQPIILCGLGRVGWRVFDYLRAAGLPVVVIDTTCDPDDPRLGGARLLKGDCRRREILQEAGVDKARGVLILTSDDLINISTALMVRHLHTDVRIVMRLFNQNLITRLGKAVSNVFALSTSTFTAPLLALTALTGQALGTFRIESLADGRRQVAELTIVQNSSLLGLTVRQACERHDLLVAAQLSTGSGDRFLLDVEQDHRLQEGDRLVLCGDPRHLGPVLAEAEAQEPVHLLWAGWLRRNGRVLWRVLAEMDTAVKMCTGVLISVIVVSTLVFHFGVAKYTIADALYRTISVVATGADMGERELNTAGLKIFVSALRILGAALIAAFTAIFTNYLLRARLGGALEIRRIPDSGHIIVCGLGNIGYRVVEELVACKERVVVIELSRDSRFLATARRLGVASIVGDATVREVLRQAHADTARAVIAVTSDDLINLEIALLVRDLNPKQRVVLRLSDPHLAQTLREAANIRLALSVPTLAAPAFVAALFGDRVQSVFLVGGRLLAVLDVLIPPNDSNLLGRSLRSAAIDYRFLPIVLMDAESSVRLKDSHLMIKAGQRLIAIMALNDLERWLRREPLACNCEVNVVEFPGENRPWLIETLSHNHNCDDQSVQQFIDERPICLGRGLTHGQAVELLEQVRERGGTAVIRNGSTS